MPRRARYTLEVGTPEGGWEQLQRVTASARRAAEQMRREGTPVRFLRSIFVPEDGACFFLFEAPTAEAVRDAAARAHLRAGPVQETIALETEAQG